MLRRFLSLLILFSFLPLCAFANTYKNIPDCLCIAQKSVRSTLSASAYQLCYYPETCQKEVNDELRTLIKALADRCVPAVPGKAGNPQEKSYVDAGASIFRTGDSWASFLLTACAVDNRQQLAVEMDARAYDMLTGKRLYLQDVVTADAMPLLQNEIRTQLTAYFPQYSTDEAKLLALIDALKETPFTLNTAFLTLHYRADALYNGHNTLMHVSIPYQALSPYLTEEAQRQTDNSGYKLVALTYDDGPARAHTLSIARALRMGAANATFFIVGDRYTYGPELISFTHDTGFSVASHNYTHAYEYEVRGKVQQHAKRMDELMAQMTGRVPTLMRAPGGAEYTYINENVNLPLLHWSMVAREDLDQYIDPYREARRLANAAQDGDIILMHDLRKITAEIAQHIPAAFAEKNLLCVTVEELFAARGLTLEPNVVYYNAYPAK